MMCRAKKPLNNLPEARNYREGRPLNSRHSGLRAGTYYHRLSGAGRNPGAGIHD